MKRPALISLLLPVLVVALVLALAGPAMAKVNGGQHYSWDLSCSDKLGSAKCWGDYQKDGSSTSFVCGSGAASSCMGYERATTFNTGPEVTLQLTCYRGVYSCLGTAFIEAGIVLPRGAPPVVFFIVGGGPTR